MRKLSLSLSALALTTLPGLALAQETAAAAPADITPYIFTTLLFLIGGFMVFWMAAGFAMLEAGLVRFQERDHAANPVHRAVFNRGHHVLAGWL